MNLDSRRGRGGVRGPIGWMAVSVLLAGCAVMLAGCERIGTFGVVQVEAKTAEANLETFLTYQEALLGKDAAAVQEVFGKPKGVFEKRTGNVWMYARWRVEFDPRGNVVRMEHDISALRRMNDG